LYFVTDDAWEVTDPVVKALQGAEGRLFPYVELALNQPLWHLDLLVSVEHGAKCWRRFILTSLEQAVSTAEEYPGISQLHYQSALSTSADRDRDYGIWHVQKVLVGRCSDGRLAHVIEFLHGREVYPDRRLLTSELVDTRCIYEASSLAGQSHSD
jgi:hypothetical protein